MPIEWTDALPYTQLRLSSCFSVRTDPDFKDMIFSTTTHLNERNSIELWRSVQAGDNPADTLDMAMRMYTGCGASRDVLGAVRLLMTLVDPENLAASKVPRSIKARALSLQAHIHYDNRFERKGAINIDVVHRAAVCANAAAVLGFISRDVLAVAQHVEAIGFRREEDNKFKEHSTERFEKLTHLWEAWDRRKAAVAREQEQQADKVAKAPQLYVCGALDCGIESTSRAGLSSCGGKCPAEVKPSYCSKECQKKDWKRHKPFCKADLTPEELEAAKAQLEPTTSSEAEDSDTVAEPSNGEPLQYDMDGVNESGKEHSVQVQLGDGNPVKLSSTTINPAFMKEVKNELETLAKEDQEGVQQS